MKSMILATAAAIAFAAPAVAADKFTLDSSHSQIIFSYNHLGYSTTSGMFSGFAGEIMFDAENPAASSVTVSMPITSMFTGWEARDAHFMSADFFEASDDETVSFTSTSIEVTGENTALITGDLTLNGITQPVVLDTVLNKSEPFPFGPNQGKPALGFDATTTISRTAFGVGNFAPAVGDEVSIQISLEAINQDGA